MDHGRGMGHETVTCNAYYDQRRRTAFYEPAHDNGGDYMADLATTPPLPSKAVSTVATIV